MPTQLLLSLSDAQLSAQLATQVLEPAGYSVALAHSAAVVRRSLSAEPPSVLFLGPLADEDPFTLAEDIKLTHPTLPVVYLALHAAQDELLRGVQLGFVDYLTLPVEPAVLLEAASRGLERGRRWEGWLRKETGRITGTLARRLSELESILQQVNDGVMLVDRERKVLMVNRAMRKAFSLGSKDPVGRPLPDVLPNKDLLELFKSSPGNNARVEIKSPAGRTYDVRLSTIAGLGTAISLHDITNLIELDHLRKDFVNTVSHDLRSPLTAILGYVELIERAGPVNPQQAEFIKRVKTSVHTTTELIDDLLDLGRVEVGLIDELSPVDMRAIVEAAAEALQAQVDAKQLVFQLAAPDVLPAVLGSHTQLGQVAANLIGNAVKYTPAGGEVRVMLRKEQRQLILHVADTGPGILLEEQGKIFDRFYRATNALPSIPGTGLGLAIVKTIVENHRGRIWVDSKVGEGSIFTVVLPLAKA
ncbi:MAG: PAS domain-containing protein [Anaerolineales bacterium]|nr:PAS domain-containing protein [Anaerolineales bacterium]